MTNKIMTVLLRLINSYFSVGFPKIVAPASIIFPRITAPRSTNLITEGLTSVSYPPYGEDLDLDLMEIIGKEVNEKDRLEIFYIENKHLLEGKEAFEVMFNLLRTTTHIFDKPRIVFVIGMLLDSTVTGEPIEYAYTYNTLVTKDTSFEEYWAEIEDYVREKYISGEYEYSKNVINRFKVLTWDVSHLENKHLVINKSKSGIEMKVLPKNDKRLLDLAPGYVKQNSKTKIDKPKGFHTSAVNLTDNSRYIKPLTVKRTKPKTDKIKGFLNTFATMDLETMDFNGEQVPVAISFSMVDAEETVTDLFFIIDHSKLIYDSNNIPTKESLDLVVDGMWQEFFDFLNSSKENSVKTIFVHNLGSFDGIFIFKYLIKIIKNVEPNVLIDNSNKFIKIAINLLASNIKWIDSYRIFPISLDNLCKTYHIKGKTEKYDMSFNNFSLFKNQELFNRFKEYAIQDSRALMNALLSAQDHIYNSYKIDLTDCLSASNLSMKIYRLCFQKINIPILKNNEDRFVRESYYGGATDVYKAIVQFVHYLDVISLYPYVMLKVMPIKLLQIITNPSAGNLDLNKFFGFLKVKVYCPSHLKRPLLPVKHEGHTIFPTGTWIATYFSEEIKEVMKLDLGYKFDILEAHAYSQEYIFKDFVEHFFKIKKESIGADRYLAKLTLNSLYGMFGRKLDVNEVYVVNGHGLLALTTRIIRNIIRLEDSRYLVSVASNLNFNILKKLNSVLETNLTTMAIPVNSNVAIASAVTAYGRITMMKYKLDPAVVYSDTDSIFTTNPKPFSDKLTDELGDFKDEMNGLIISKAIFLGIKQYAYQYLTQDNNVITRTVFSGVLRDSLTYEQFELLLSGGDLKIKNKNRFYKSLTHFNIKIKDTETIILKSSLKPLVNNEYLPTRRKNINTLNQSLLENKRPLPPIPILI